jgi:transposase
VLLVAAYWRTNLTLRQLAPLFGISKSSADRIIDHTAPQLALKTSFPLAGWRVGLVVESLVERLVPDELWELFRRVVPETFIRRPQGGGRRRAGDRETLAAIVFVATSGCTWRQLPPVFGPCWQTVYRRFALWSRDRVWAWLHRVILDELGSRGELDWSRCAIDSVSIRATKGGP